MSIILLAIFFKDRDREPNRKTSVASSATQID